MKEFYFTFGFKYKRVPHPTVPGAHPDGYWVVVAETEEQARQKFINQFGNLWAFTYDKPPDPYFCPRGELGRLE